MRHKGEGKEEGGRRRARRKPWSSDTWFVEVQSPGYGRGAELHALTGGVPALVEEVLPRAQMFQLLLQLQKSFSQ